MNHSRANHLSSRRYPSPFRPPRPVPHPLSDLGHFHHADAVAAVADGRHQLPPYVNAVSDEFSFTPRSTARRNTGPKFEDAAVTGSTAWGHHRQQQRNIAFAPARNDRHQTHDTSFLRSPIQETDQYRSDLRVSHQERTLPSRSASSTFEHSQQPNSRERVEGRRVTSDPVRAGPLRVEKPLPQIDEGFNHDSDVIYRPPGSSNYVRFDTPPPVGNPHDKSSHLRTLQDSPPSIPRIKRVRIESLSSDACSLDFKAFRSGQGKMRGMARNVPAAKEEKVSGKSAKPGLDVDEVEEEITCPM